MSLYSDLTIIVFSSKTGKAIKHYLKNVPRIGDAIVSDNRKLYRVEDVVWDGFWHKRLIRREVRVYVVIEEGSKSK